MKLWGLTRSPLSLLALAAILAACPRKEEPRPTAPVSAEKQAQPAAAEVTIVPIAADVAASTPAPVAEADTLPSEATKAGGNATVDLPPLAHITWAVVPEKLDVMRDTVVRLDASWGEVPEADYECRWDPGDRSGLRTGCHVEHRFVGGLADRMVTLAVLYRGSEVYSTRKALPLERLPIRELPPEASTLPPHPEQEGSLRLLILPLYAPPTAETGQALRNAADVSGADLVVVMFNTEVTAENARGLLDVIGGGSGRRRVVPVYCGGGAGGLPTGDTLDLLAHGPGAELPYRAGLLVGSTLLVLMDSRRSGVVVDEEKWLSEQLDLGKVAEHRIVVSCRPFEPLTARQAAELAPRYRYYEKLLRGDISLLVSSSHPAWFSGSYGQIPVLSPGCTTGQPEPLLGALATQPRSASVVDLVAGLPPRARVVSAERPAEILEIVIPAKVGNYERRK